jgi:hypothetical protein
LTSLKSHFERNPAKTREKWVLEAREAVYGSTDFNVGLMVTAYNRHIEDVSNYFKNRQNNLLIINICDGEGWNILCPFLSKSIPNEPFPKINTSTSKNKML